MTSVIRDAIFEGPGPEAQFRTVLAKGRFYIQECAPCGKKIFYPRVICPYCGSTQLRMIEASGRGTVYSTSIVRQKPEAGGDYSIALIDLEEGPRMMSRVVNIPPADVMIGMAVRAKVSELGGEPVIFFEKD